MLFPQVRYVQSLLAAGQLGEVYSASGHGHFGVPPWPGYTSDPTPFFARGAGPAIDMGVYPLHVLTGLLGPVRRVTAMIGKVLDQFTIEEGPFQGKIVPVEANDNWFVLLDFGGSRLAVFTANNCVQATRAPMVEIRGLAGTVGLDPIDVSAPVEVMGDGAGWRQVPPPFEGTQAIGRASGPDHHLGIEHLVDCIQHNREPILSVEHALHVVEILEKAELAAARGEALALETTFERGAVAGRRWPN
jgi:predicted dehydrogenase